MSRNQRINAVIELGRFLTDLQNTDEIEEWATAAYRKNNWFTPENVKSSLLAIGNEFLEHDKITTWAASYAEPENVKKIGIIMAGNIPAVGFHDALCVLVSGHILLAKPASDDPLLIRYLLQKLSEIEPGFKENIQFVERLNDADAYVATGSDNTARYFHYYFSKKPHIIRKNRTSVAILTGGESDQDLAALGNDIFQYYGLGCRNVSKLFVPAGYDFTKFYKAIDSYSVTCMHHHKYFNNYEYNKSILLVNRVLHFDNGFLLLTENTAFVSAISVVHFEYYNSLDEVKPLLEESTEKIQCVVGGKDLAIDSAVAFGQAQEPGLSDYADSVDTMLFLSKL
ncbi:acyl-CoA reductase [Dyadobacter psychrotolerans]|uniref:Acyl-CoA reductase n=1 Tax=Dyadobacter psychrotolerans TaxID=2541721 RepID=A0A4R5DND7_9BACT|nr:acyl-CoA reductase [Dyadobacter psychrotolerans]